MGLPFAPVAGATVVMGDDEEVFLPNTVDDADREAGDDPPTEVAPERRTGRRALGDPVRRFLYRDHEAPYQPIKTRFTEHDRRVELCLRQWVE